MLCQNCGNNEANVRYTQIVNGVKKEMVLCEECAAKTGINNFKINMPISFSNFLGDFFDDYDTQLMPNFIKEKHNQCTNCGELYDDFIKTGLLGCYECYDMFKDRIEPVLKNIHSSTQHIGRKPINIAEKLNNIGENNAKAEPKNEIRKESKDNQKENNKELEQLQHNLNKAIKEERYEDAAIIRDKIKNLDNKK